MKLFLVSLLAYLLGNISFSLIIGKIFFKKDVRDYGSGNAGATNAIRAFGAKFGILTFIGDMLKGVCAALIGKSVAGVDGLYIASIMVIVGHNWPVFMKFKGGKGVATTIGTMFVALPFITLICFIIGISIAYFTRIVSLGSLIGVILTPLAVLLFVRPFDVKLFLFVITYTLMCLFKHRGNIKRLIKKEERKL
ncbi:glycerol-3-phosphate 1-O-acyltransferase PlsY [Sedimentibacter sp. zth1]|uniref:glycerol-3-phosphate 1-O-acyltransferase PlsY n=1 Tax=Sedimentibacter sp. zth1 TaxID=2816908 RepID=UPI001F5EEA38|nr:glycerol-3-phosphate 1-O-acyltransferase PlsY [Sedimentibacter sp. zth1]